MTEQQQDRQRKGARDSVSDGVRQGLGILSAFKEALEETINEARERGDLSSDRAKEVLKGAMARARTAADEAKERLDFVPQKDFDALRARVDELKVRLENLERRASQDPAAGPVSGGEPPAGP